MPKCVSWTKMSKLALADCHSSTVCSPDATWWSTYGQWWSMFSDGQQSTEGNHLKQNTDHRRCNPGWTTSTPLGLCMECRLLTRTNYSLLKILLLVWFWLLQWQWLSGPVCRVPAWPPWSAPYQWWFRKTGTIGTVSYTHLTLPTNREV